MLDASGFLYPAEGKRRLELRTARSLTDGATISELLTELAVN